MGALRDRMFANMRMRNFSPKTIKAYLWHVREFTKYFGKSPDLLGEEEVRLYLLYLQDERQVSWSNINIGYSALRFFYVETLHRDWQVKKIPRPKVGRRLPVVLSRRELKQFFFGDRQFQALGDFSHHLLGWTQAQRGCSPEALSHRKRLDADSRGTGQGQKRPLHAFVADGAG